MEKDKIIKTGMLKISFSFSCLFKVLHVCSKCFCEKDILLSYSVWEEVCQSLCTERIFNLLQIGHHILKIHKNLIRHYHG